VETHDIIFETGHAPPNKCRGYYALITTIFNEGQVYLFLCDFIDKWIYNFPCTPKYGGHVDNE
jgi:hypothetical protein